MIVKLQLLNSPIGHSEFNPAARESQLSVRRYVIIRKWNHIVIGEYQVNLAHITSPSVLDSFVLFDNQ
ncbi:hypothetical protein Mal33_50560 [Rosistilla oblonga]|uniref:Uncharacterized protein n=1 Tax=Rosistilla oblonga TaxID=2527990 RepID=A0A518J110_9BACT|nr:hypothetical protein Mal33_50560 [Rosistilla oblonga]